jgi:hypothetical protein
LLSLAKRALRNGKIAFVLETDDGRVLILSGEFYEPFWLAEILTDAVNTYSHLLL